MGNDAEQHAAGPHPLLRWRVYKIKLGSTTANYVCANEESLSSFVLANATGMTATVPIKFQRLAHRALHESYTYPLHCFPSQVESATLPVEDLIGVHEALALELAKPEDIEQLEELADLLTNAIEDFLRAKA